jgi:ubiquinone/menaquinone biosynthesis C-methylase UbiE
MRKNNYASTNKEWWEKMAKEDCGFTKPWLDLDVKILQKLASGKLKNPPKPLNDIYPIGILSGIKGKDVLCLASGGGQQSSVFALLGANVTVIDIAEGQLEGDKKAAEHYGYKVKTIQGDMSDLSTLKDNSFDIVYQAPSMSYVPDVKKVYSEVARVLRSGGLYRADAHNPQAFHFEDWDGKGYCISKPYAVKEQKRSENENVLEYRHYLDEAFNGLIECGFAIEQVKEMPKNLYQSENDEPGSWGHSLKYIPGIFCILARRK